MNFLNRRRITHGLLASLLGMLSLGTQAQEGAPAKIIVGFPAGGSFDAIARLIADKAKSELATIKQQAEKDKAEFEVRVPWIVVMCLTCPVDPA